MIAPVRGSSATSDAAGPPGWLLALYTLGAVFGLVLAGRYILRPFFRLIGNLGEREMFVFAALFTVIASAAMMQALGLSLPAKRITVNLAPADIIKEGSHF